MKREERDIDVCVHDLLRDVRAADDRHDIVAALAEGITNSTACSDGYFAFTANAAHQNSDA